MRGFPPRPRSARGIRCAGASRNRASARLNEAARDMNALLGARDVQSSDIRGRRAVGLHDGNAALARTVFDHAGTRASIGQVGSRSAALEETQYEHVICTRCGRTIRPRRSRPARAFHRFHFALLPSRAVFDLGVRFAWITFEARFGIVTCINFATAWLPAPCAPWHPLQPSPSRCITTISPCGIRR